MSANVDRHPEPWRLDALAVGDRDDDASAHVEACEACAKYVAAIADGQARFTREEAPRADEFVARVRARAARPERAGRGAWMAGAGAVLALAACVLLYVGVARTGAGPSSAPTGGTTSATSAPGPIRFKGGVQASVIVDHGGVQSRRAGPLELAPGDRVQLEVAVDHDTPIAAGVLADDGEWAELQAPATFAPGTRYSDRSVSFDGDVPAGFIVLGDPDAVAAARRTHDLSSVIAIRVKQQP